MNNLLQSSTNIQILEINLISAQELKPPRLVASRGLCTYAVVWIDPTHKLKSRVDETGHENPTWNDKFAFAVAAEKLKTLACSAQLAFEFYCVAKIGRDRFLGSSRVLLEDCACKSDCTAGVFRAFYVRRPNGEPHGILNIGVRVLDGLAYKVISDQFVRNVMAGSGIDHNTLAGVNKDVDGKFIKWFFRKFLLRGEDKKEKKVYSTISYIQRLLLVFVCGKEK